VGAAPAPIWLQFSLPQAFFLGSLYFLVLAQSNALVLATPLGGICFLAGWAALAWAALKQRG
jgi:uncharacterized membrane protein YgdD (TMEM256/DUF423 family)